MRSQFIPVRKSDIVARLAADKDLAGEARHEVFAGFCKLLGLTIHYEFFDELERMKDAYFHFEPRVAGARPEVATTSEAAYAELIGLLVDVLGRANFIEAPADEVERAYRERGLLPVEVKSHLDDYREIRFFHRGEHVEMVEARDWLGRRQPPRQTTVYDDVVLFAAVSPAPAAAGIVHRRHRPAGGVFIKFFHDIASADLNTLLPDVRVIMNKRDRWVLGLPALVGGVPLVLKLAPTLALLFLLLGIQLGYSGTVEQNHLKQALAVMSGAVALGSFAAHQWLKYQRKALRYLIEIKDSIYFRNVNNNAGVFDALVGAAEEQEFKEAVLAYRFLSAEPLDKETLDGRVEAWLKDQFGVDVDFEVDDGLAKLERYGLLVRAGNRLSVPSLAEALSRLDERWDGYFQYDKPAA